jgi:3-phosphoglycerate kinase
MNKLFIEDLTNLRGKRVLMRVDFNVPLDQNQKITSESRIDASLPSITYLMGQGAKTILMSHLGRPKGPNSKESLKPVAMSLSGKIGKPVFLVPDCVGPEAEKTVRAMQEGDVVLLENLRFHPQEEKNDPGFARQLASLGDLYVNDAFGTAHRAHASTEGVTRFFKQNACGYLMKKELDYLGKVISNPERPFAAILGGAKISGKIDVINNLLDKVDIMIIGGGMAFTFYKAMGFEVGRSLLENDKIHLAKDLLEIVKTKKVKFVLPVDCVAATEFSETAESKVVAWDKIPADRQCLDIGPDTVKEFAQVLDGAKTIFWNGPMGVFEMPKFAAGTNGLARVIADLTAQGATTIVGGGDSASAIKKAGLSKKFSHISTGGGASLEFVEGKVLPGAAALTDK